MLCRAVGDTHESILYYKHQIGFIEANAHVSARRPLLGVARRLMSTAAIFSRLWREDPGINDLVLGEPLHPPMTKLASLLLAGKVKSRDEAARAARPAFIRSFAAGSSR
jgi:hypothetical protein